MNNILDGFFGQEEENARTFLEAVPDMVKEDREKFITGQPDKVLIPKIVDQKSGKILISHGYDGNDYVWNIAPISEMLDPRTNKMRRVTVVFKVSEDVLIYSIVKVLNTTIPNTCKVDIWTPYADWDLKIYTFKAYDLMQYWQIDEKRLNELTAKLFDLLNTLV